MNVRSEGEPKRVRGTRRGRQTAARKANGGEEGKRRRGTTADRYPPFRICYPVFASILRCTAGRRDLWKNDQGTAIFIL
jgi:hypothetical protein